MKLIASLYCLLISTTVYSQTGIDSLLSQVSRNNKAIQAKREFELARKAEFKTGLTPYDPTVEYDYLSGSPAGAGNQRDFAVTQQLDFPSVYGSKRKLSVQQGIQSDLQHRVFSQDILLKAKLEALELIYLNKLSAELKHRLERTQALVSDYQKKLDKGDAIILDVNKAKLQLLNIQQDVLLNDNAISQTLTRLQELNGGMEISLTDTIYPFVAQVPNFRTLDSLIEANDPLLQVYEQEQLIRQQQITVQKRLNLPKIETGYHSQAILGQSYKGVHGGISIPLWENRNRVKAAEANLNYANFNAVNHKLEHQLENKQYYDQLEVRENAMAEYRTLLSSLNNAALLDKALKFGQITIIQYAQDERFYFDSYLRYLQMEAEYHKALARLYKFMLN
ncbi:MAG: TolC family protein [Daejeonella sp.]|uniref:TolC family protein n=1 Tax=Daejeonella sp. TaxID=2805397 RepID=UPI003C7915D6